MSKSRNHRLLEDFIVVDLLLGTFAVYEIVKILKYVMSLLLQGKVLFNIFASKKLSVNPILLKYFLAIICIIFIGLIFFLKAVETELIINRVFPLLSMFGFILFLEPNSNINLERIVKNFCKYYVLLALIIDVDSLSYLFVGKSLWQPISWMGLRYCGPFGDPNFFALFSGTVLLIIWFDHSIFPKHRKIAISILMVSLLLAMALSTLILLPLSVLLSRIFRRTTNIQKQVVILCFYLWFMSVYAIAGNDIFNFVTKVLTYFYGDIGDAALKYSSLEIRLDTQLAALKIFFNDLWGQGPQQIVAQLDHDTHNSYVSIAFADGIFGLLLIFLTLRNKKARKVENVVGTFLMVSALLLNIHEHTIYSLFVLMQYYKKRQFNSHDAHSIISNT